MTGKFRNWHHLILSVSLVLCTLAPAMAQQGQYLAHDVGFAHPSLKSGSALATYYPILLVDGQTIQLRGEDGMTFTFTIDANTVFCQGTLKVADWVYLRAVKKKASVTVVTSDSTDNKALIIWDQPPAISTAGNSFQFSLPPVCK